MLKIYQNIMEMKDKIKSFENFGKILVILGKTVYNIHCKQ